MTKIITNYSPVIHCMEQNYNRNNILAGFQTIEELEIKSASLKSDCSNIDRYCMISGDDISDEDKGILIQKKNEYIEQISEFIDIEYISDSEYISSQIGLFNEIGKLENKKIGAEFICCITNINFQNRHKYINNKKEIRINTELLSLQDIYKMSQKYLRESSKIKLSIALVTYSDAKRQLLESEYPNAIKNEIKLNKQILVPWKEEANSTKYMKIARWNQYTLHKINNNNNIERVKLSIIVMKEKEQ